MYGRCMEDVWKMYGRCTEDVWKMYGRCMEDVWKRFTRNVFLTLKSSLIARISH
jgi:hypothetical protein